MEIKAKAKHIRMSPKKIRLVADIVRGMETVRALNQLNFINKKAAGPIIKLIKSAIANAVHNYELDGNNLYIKEIKIDEGKVLKRWMPRAHGRATPVRKGSSHIILVLAEIKDSGTIGAKKRKIEAPVNLKEMTKKVEGDKVKREEKEAKVAEKAVKPEEVKKSEELTSGKSAVLKPEKADKKGFVSRMFRRKRG